MIKFEGRDSYGQWHEGDLIHEAEIVMIVEPRARYVVDPRTVKQFVCFDKNGRSIFEGDVVTDEFGNEWQAGFLIPPYEKMELKKHGDVGRNA